MSAIRKLIEWTRAPGFGPTTKTETDLADAAEAELKELEGQLETRDRLLSQTVDLHARSLNKLAERDRADAELLAAFRSLDGPPVTSRAAKVWVALNRWAAAKGGGE